MIDGLLLSFLLAEGGAKGKGLTEIATGTIEYMPPEALREEQARYVDSRVQAYRAGLSAGANRRITAALHHRSNNNMSSSNNNVTMGTHATTGCTPALQPQQHACRQLRECMVDGRGDTKGHVEVDWPRYVRSMCLSPS